MGRRRLTTEHERQGPLGRLLCQINRAGWEKLAEAVDYRLRHLAALCGAPPWLLERLFKQQFRKAPVAWLRLLKCRRAAALIRAGQYLKEAASPSAFGSASDLCHQFKKAWGSRPNAMPLAGIAGGRVESDLDKAAPLLSKSIVVGLLSEVTRVTGLEGGQKPARHFLTPPQLAQPALRLHGGPAWPSAHTRLWGCLERKGAIAWAGTAAKCPKLWFDPCYFFCVRCVCLLIVLCLRNHSAAAGAPVSTRNKSR